MSFHLYRISQIYSSADATVQYIELTVGASNGESFWFGQTITVTDGTTTHQFTFPVNLPSTATANTTVLIATQGFAALGIVTPDFIVPDGFLLTGGGSVNYAGVDNVTYAALPTDGIHAVSRTGAIVTATPIDFHGATGQLPPPGTVITGTAGNDVLAHGTGNETLDGGAGIDTASLGVRLADLLGYQIAGTQIQLNLSNGHVTLNNIERVAFVDKLFVFDTHPGEPAWQTDALLWAGFGIAPTPDALRLWMPLSTQATNMAQLGQEMLDHYAPGLSASALVRYLYGTIAGVNPTDGQVAEYADQVGPGKAFETTGALFAFAASLQLNTDRMVDLVGSVQQVDLTA